MFQKITTLLITSFLIITSTFAQFGSIQGTVRDSEKMELIIGATVRVEGTTMATVSDINGKFAFNKVPTGKNTIKISYVGYQENTLSNILVEDGKEATANVVIVEDVNMLNNVVITSSKVTSTDLSVLKDIKQAQQIVVGLSSQQIQKSQDRDASAVVRRISGVSIFDERFVVIRGLNERYNTVLLNDIIAPSTEVDSKAFSFDLIPSAAIDRMMVSKSSSSDLPGDVSGGAIKIYTKSNPEENALTASLSISYRPNTTGNSYNADKGSKTDWLGFDNGTRALPDNFPSRNSIALLAKTEAINERFRDLPAFYNVENTTVQPDIRANINYAHSWKLGGKKLSNVSFINYSNAYQGLAIEQNRFLFDGSVEKKYFDKSLNHNVRIGAMSNWALTLNSNNKIEFKNFFNQIGTSESVFRTGYNENVDFDNGSFRYEQRSIYNGQLNGIHTLSKSSKLKWYTAIGHTFRAEPDYRRFSRSRAKGSNDEFVFDLQQSDSPTLQQSARSFSELDESVKTLRLDYEKSFDKSDATVTKKNLKIGMYSSLKDRDFENRWYGITNPNRLGSESSVFSSDPREFFDPSNLGGDKVYYGVGTNFEDKYTASNIFTSGYGQVNTPVLKRMYLSAGVRAEYNQQELSSRNRGSGSLIYVENPAFNLLPAVNLSYEINKKSKLRIAYSNTVNRPEFREIAPFTYYDFVYDVTRTGYVPTADKPKLENATISNLDLQYEYYFSEDEMVTVTLFNKRFQNPIEAKLLYNGSNVAFTVDNAYSAVSNGVEVEIRKKLGTQFTTLINGAFINGNVQTGQGQTLLERSLQGQSPYLINAALFYTSKKGLQANLLYNIIGKRIFVIGDDQISANIYEMPRNVLDFNMSKRLKNSLELKLVVQDIFNQKFRLVQDTDRNQIINNNDGVYQEYRRGTYTTLGISYKF
ncbi:MAG: carboxypeptidase-like regulatory domain-containing protein [Leadbetterella sp.]